MAMASGGGESGLRGRRQWRRGSAVGGVVGRGMSVGRGGGQW